MNAARTAKRLQALAGRQPRSTAGVFLREHQRPRVAVRLGSTGGATHIVANVFDPARIIQ